MSLPSWTSLPCPTPSHPSLLSQSHGLSSRSHTANPPGSIYMWECICLHAILSITPPSSSSSCVHMSVLYVCISTAALHIDLSIPSFKIQYICINILYLFFSFWLTSLCITGSEFIDLIRTDSNVFLFGLSNSLLYICMYHYFPSFIFKHNMQVHLFTAERQDRITSKPPSHAITERPRGSCALL